MGNLNKVLLIGRLGQDPEKRVTPGGHSVVSVNLATSERFTDKAGNKQERTEWHRLVFWNKLADLVEQYCKKGSQLYVEGSLQTSEWQDKDGSKRYKTEIVCQNLQFLDSKPEGQSTGYQKPQSGYQQPQQGGYQAPQGGYQTPQAGGYAAKSAQPQYQANPPQNYQQPQSGPDYGPPPNDDFIEDDI